LQDVTNDRPNLDPIAAAMEWVTKITTVGLEMVLPAVGGAFLDKRLSTNYWALVGLGFGVVFGIWHLLQMTKATRPNGGNKGPSGGSTSE